MSLEPSQNSRGVELYGIAFLCWLKNTSLKLMGGLTIY